MTKLTTILITILMIAILGFMVIDEANGQERTLIHEYKNTRTEDLGGGKKRFSMTLSRSHRVEKDATNIYRIAGTDTVAFSLSVGIDKYTVTSNIGKFNAIDTNKIEYDFDTRFDVTMIADTVYFRDNGQLKARMIFTDGWYNNLSQKVGVTKKSLVGNKVALEFSENISSTKSDIWSWQPDATAGLDNNMRTDDSTTNLGTNTVLVIGWHTSVIRYRGLIKFAEIGNNIPADATINWACIILKDNGSAIGDLDTLEVYSMKRNWVELQSTWNIYSTGNNWAAAGAYHTDDIYLVNADTTRAIVQGNVDTVWVTNNVKQIAGVDSSITNNGFLIKGSAGSEFGVTKYFVVSSSDAGTPGNRPELVINYTGTSPPSVPPNPPINVYASIDSAAYVSVTWDSGLGGATQYAILCSLLDGSLDSIGAVGADTFVYTDSDSADTSIVNPPTVLSASQGTYKTYIELTWSGEIVTDGASRFYRIKAINGDGDSLSVPPASGDSIEGYRTETVESDSFTIVASEYSGGTFTTITENGATGDATLIPPSKVEIPYYFKLKSQGVQSGRESIFSAEFSGWTGAVVGIAQPFFNGVGLPLLINGKITPLMDFP